MSFEWLIPIVIVSWANSPVQPEILEGNKVYSVAECMLEQERLMYEFTEKYPYFWKSDYTGMCVSEKGDIL